MNLNVHVRKCHEHEETNRNAIDTLINGSDFDPRITIAVGLLRFLLDCQRSEIQILMESAYPLERYPFSQGNSFSDSTASTSAT